MAHYIVWQGPTAKLVGALEISANFALWLAGANLLYVLYGVYNADYSEVNLAQQLGFRREFAQDNKVLVDHVLSTRGRDIHLLRCGVRLHSAYQVYAEELTRPLCQNVDVRRRLIQNRVMSQL